MGRTVTAALIIIGNEILSGRTRDANLPFLAGRLNDLGVRLVEVRVVSDDGDAIAGAVNALRAANDYVFTTGGIGPTHDDITAAAVAGAFGRPLVRSAEAVARMERFYSGSGLELNEARLRMANTPEGAELVDNPVSGAPGFRMENVYVFAGVPTIMEAMFEGMKHELVGGAPMLSRTIAVGLAEGHIAEALGALQERHGGVEIGSYPYYRAGAFGVKLVLRSTDEARLAAAVAELVPLLEDLGGEPVEQSAGEG